ncbi:MAG: DUF2202 domain-containing protein [Bryobacteraceae bacterium]
MKRSTLIRTMLVTATALAASLPAAAQRGPGRGPGSGAGARTPIVVEPATAEEVQMLTFMREEEKLARDVYRFLSEKWGHSVFDRIADSEQQHFVSVGTLIVRYGVQDPAATDTPGVFQDAKLASLYAELTAKGAASLKDAFEVGILIEKTDIADLEKAVATTKLDIKRVYTNLMNASFNHLEAFETCLETVTIAN